MTGGALRLLLVEDNPGDALLVREALASLPSPPMVTALATSLATALDALGGGGIDVVLSDLDLPDSDGIDTCRALVQAAGGLPVVVLTGRDGDELGAEAIRAGAQDYLEKGLHIGPRLHRSLCFAQERQRLMHAEQAARATAEAANQRTAAAYARLERLERTRDAMVQMLVHDLRSPLTAIRGYLEMYLGNTDPDHEQRRHYVAIADSQAGVLVEMVSSILDVSRMEADELRPQLAPNDVAALAAEAVDRVRGGALHKRVVITAMPVVVRCDAELVRRVIVNLVANALRYSPLDDHVTVLVTKDRAPGMVRVVVQDRGPGIPAEAQHQLFEKFATLDQGTRRPYSTGLGLHFCKLAVEAHGGRIGVDSVLGEGSRFWFVLPSGRSSDDTGRRGDPAGS